MVDKRGKTPKKPQTKRQHLLVDKVRSAVAVGKRVAYLEFFGDELAKRYGYKAHEGMDAIHYYLVEKYKWLPGHVRSLSDDDLLFLLEEEMDGWALPADLRGLFPADRD
jgi:hypothetical protein